MKHRESAICLRTSDYSETSQVVHFLTRGWGLVRLLAKGTKRPKSKSGGPIDLLSEGDLVFIASSGSSLGTLTEFSETASHTALRQDSVRLNTAMYLIELTGQLLAEADPHPEVFDLLHNALARLGDPQAPLAAVLAYFQWRLLRHVGIMGELQECVSCGASVTGAGGKAGGTVYFTATDGGLLCGDCEGAATEKLRVTGGALAGAAALAAAEAGRKVSLPEQQADDINRLLAYHVRHQLGRPLKMAKHVIGLKS